MKPIKFVYSLWFMVERLKKQKTQIFTLFFFLLLLTINYQPSTAFAAIPKLINYQGRLTDSQGQPITGTKSVTFRIYDVESGGSPLWQETHTTTFDKGIFNLFIGGVTPLNLPFDKQYYLGIQVGSDPEMSPRQRLASVGYAFRANVADDAIQSQNAVKVNNIEASTTPQANKLLPLDANAKFPSSSLGLKVYDSGWVAVNLGGSAKDFTVTHNLGTQKIIFKLLIGNTPNGSGWIMEAPYAMGGAAASEFLEARAITNNTVIFGAYNFMYVDSNNAKQGIYSPTDLYYRFIAIALD